MRPNGSCHRLTKGSLQLFRSLPAVRHDLSPESTEKLTQRLRQIEDEEQPTLLDISSRIRQTPSVSRSQGHSVTVKAKQQSSQLRYKYMSSNDILEIHERLMRQQNMPRALLVVQKNFTVAQPSNSGVSRTLNARELGGRERPQAAATLQPQLKYNDDDDLRLLDVGSGVKSNMYFLDELRQKCEQLESNAEDIEKQLCNLQADVRAAAGTAQIYAHILKRIQLIQ